MRSRYEQRSCWWPRTRCRRSSRARRWWVASVPRSSSTPPTRNTRAAHRAPSRRRAPLDTFSFVGVTTGQSAATRLFPAWAEELGLGDIRLVGRDLPIHASRQQYRDLVQGIKSDEHARGALITTHKIDLFEACRDLFDAIDETADLCGETSCLYKRDGLLRAQATDSVAAGRSLGEFLPEDHWRTSGEV